MFQNEVDGRRLTGFSAKLPGTCNFLGNPAVLLGSEADYEGSSYSL
jgi:hypothetical protein